jgi:hypothetical protein
MPHTVDGVVPRGMDREKQWVHVRDERIKKEYKIE